MGATIGTRTKFDYIDMESYLRAKELSSRFGNVPELKYVHEYIEYIEKILKEKEDK